jgi:hypothetical protein
VRVTLDLNALIDLEERREPFVHDVQRIIGLARQGRVALSIPAVAAAENRRLGEPRITNFGEFRRRVDRLGLGADIEYLSPILYLDVSFADHAVLGGDALSELEARIHQVLPPHNVPIESPSSEQRDRWMNKKADVQTIWCHAWYGTDLLVTRDRTLLQKAAALREAQVPCNIVHPGDEAFRVMP